MLLNAMEWYLRFNSPKESMHTDKEQGEMQSRTWPPQGQAVGGCGTEISWHHTALKSPGFVHHQLAAVNYRALLHIWKAKRLFWPMLHYFFRGSRSFYWFCIFFVIDFLIYLFFAKKVSTWFTSKRRLLSSPHFFTQLVAYPPCGQNAGVPKKQCLCAHSQKWDPKTTSVLCLIALRAQLALYHSPGRSMWVL